MSLIQGCSKSSNLLAVRGNLVSFKLGSEGKKGKRKRTGKLERGRDKRKVSEKIGLEAFVCLWDGQKKERMRATWH